MVPSQLNLRALERPRLPILIVSIPKWRQGRAIPDVYRLKKCLLVILRAEIVRWVSESKRPFKIVEDRGFKKLMKTGRPEYYIPSPQTVSRDVKKVFVCVHKRVAKILQVSIMNGMRPGMMRRERQFYD